MLLILDQPLKVIFKKSDRKKPVDKIKIFFN